MAAVCTIGDLDLIHCSQPVRAQGSVTVFAEGVGISRQGDLNGPHLLPGTPCPAHAAPITLGSITVFVNGKGCGRIGDSVTACTAVATGCPTVFAGG